MPTAPTAALESSDTAAHTLTSTASPESSAVAEAPEFAKPLSSRKRRRSSKPSPVNIRETRASQGIFSSTKTLSPQFTPPAMTAAAAIADEKRAGREGANLEDRQTSPNPNPTQKVIDLLAAQMSPTSRKEDGPSGANSISTPLAEVAPSINFNSNAQTEDVVQTSPQSTASFVSHDKAPATTITSNGASVASPGHMDDALGEDDGSPRQSFPDDVKDDSAHLDEGRSNKAFTYPGPMGAQAHRTASLPQSGYGRDSTDSSSHKKHRCQYCNTHFTRHHNLKSHLLTHSQEKPFSCDTCDARFRRLHDLKRHTKLHTGERPHVCPKCDRSFARGDALARHNKGQGGCAGRRESMGSFGGDDRQESGIRGDGDSMAGIMYTGEASHEPEHMDEDSGSPGTSLPSIRKHEAPLDSNHRPGLEHTEMYQSRQPSTYPPIAGRPPTTGGLYPPPPISSPRAGSGTSVAQSSLNQYRVGSNAPSAFQASGPNVFAQGGMTESPKPLSPGGMSSHQLGHTDPGISRNRSPSLTQQFHQHQFGRRTTGNNTSPSMSLPPPHPGIANSNPPHLPPLQGLTPPEPRYTLQSQSIGPSHVPLTASSSLPGPPHGPGSPSYPPGNLSSANNSLSSHSTGPQTSLDRNHNAYNQSYDRLLAMYQSQEARINQLENEVSTLKSQCGETPPPR